MSESITIGTHDGVFHADDVFACAALTVLYPHAKIVRSRDANDLANCTYVVDVGNEYDPDRGRYDHHQRGRAGAQDGGVFYSAFGLVWKHHGPAICSTQDVPEEFAYEVAEIVRKRLVAPVDAIDNGQRPKLDPNASQYIPTCSVSAVVSSFNPTWLETQDGWQARYGFKSALDLCSWLLRRFIADAWARAKADSVLQKLNEAGEQIVLLEQPMSWQNTLRHPNTMFVVFPAQGDAGRWVAQAVPVKPGGFENRKSFPATWAGLRDEELQQIADEPDARFCHNNLYLVVAASQEGAVRLARKALL